MMSFYENSVDRETDLNVAQRKILRKKLKARAVCWKRHSWVVARTFLINLWHVW